MSNKSLRMVFLSTAVLAVIGCGSEGADDELTGRAEIAITQVPPDVRCVRIVAAGSRVRQQDFNVMPGQSSILALNALPTGTVTFSGDAFNSPCNQVGGMSTPTYTADPVTAQVSLPAIAQVTLAMRRNGRASVSVDFEPDTGPACVGTPCMDPMQCCAGTTCTGDPSGMLSCQPTTQCTAAGAPCQTNGPCCGANVCIPDPATMLSVCGSPMCGVQGTPCVPGAPNTCCGGFTCGTNNMGNNVCQGTTMCGGPGAMCAIGSMGGCCPGLSCTPPGFCQ
jgi:hypothetical protein